MALDPLATVDDFEQWTGITSYDLGRLEAALLRASSAVRTETRQTISRVTGDTVTFQSGDRLLLPQRPADVPSSFISNGLAVAGFTLTGQQLSGLGYYWWGPYPLTVTYSHGYTTVPDEVTAVVCDVAARALDNPDNVRQVGNVVFAAESIGSPTLTPAEVDRVRTVLGFGSAVAMSL